MEYMKSYIDEDTVKSKVHVAIGLLLSNDAVLLEDEDHEISIAHRLALYLQQEFADWNVDCDYNRFHNEPKLLNGALIRPDIIVHHRRIDDNLLVVETKKQQIRAQSTKRNHA
jgi:hypothetical protein